MNSHSIDDQLSNQCLMVNSKRRQRILDMAAQAATSIRVSMSFLAMLREIDV
jgi:hypothetical protein